MNEQSEDNGKHSPTRASGIVSTKDLVRGPTSRWDKVAPLQEVEFAPLESLFLTERTNIYPYGQASAGLNSYGGVSFSSLAAPLYAYHLRVSTKSELVRAGRKPAHTTATKYEWIPGTWIYGGELMPHFGHAMSESLHRIHPLLTWQNRQADSGPLSGIIFAAQVEKLPAFTKELLFEYYGLNPTQIKVVCKRPATVEQLIHVPQGSILGGASSLPGYLDILSEYQDRNLARHRSMKHPKRLFLSRRHIKETGGGQIANEEYIATELSRHGFEEFRPEEHPLTIQLSVVSQATHIALVGGSAVHMMEHLGSVPAKTLLISRGDRDSFYHPRPLGQRMRHLDILNPESGEGDQVQTFKAENDREVSQVYYREERISSAISNWLSR